MRNILALLKNRNLPEEQNGCVAWDNSGSDLYEGCLTVASFTALMLTFLL